MNNESTPLEQSLLMGQQDLSGCFVIRSANDTSFTNWENIPETILLNGTFGFVLFMTFLICTHVAWRRSGVDEPIYNQNIIDFLYGYRDPEHWYVIPRYEFIRPRDRHHQHDLNYPYLYMAPKLPLANPIEAFFIDSDTDLDTGLQSTRTKSMIEQTQSDNTLVISQPENRTTPEVPQVGERIPRLSCSSTNQPQNKSMKSQLSALKSTKLPKSAGSDLGGVLKNTGCKSFNRSFIYPSILSAEQLQASPLSRWLNVIFSKFFKVTDADIIYARGIDAYEYLLFQRHLILIMFIANLLCLGAILPIHWFAGTNVDPDVTTSFQRTTIKNMGPQSHFHWAHIICSTIIVVACVFIMNSYKESISTRDDSQLSRRTLLIGNIPQEQRSRVHLLNALLEYIPRVNIEAIQFVYDFSALYDYESYLSSAIVAKDYCRAYKLKHNKELMIHKTDVNQGRYCNGSCRLCSLFYVCCFYWPCEGREPGTDYYAHEEKVYREKIVNACEKMVNEPTEYAFVTFKTNKQARRVMQELAALKQEAFEERLAPLTPRQHVRPSDLSGVITGPLEPKSGSVSRDDIEANKSPVIRKSIIEQEKRDIKVVNNKASNYLVSGNVDNDPLDPKNDPHVRSIRSPKVLNKKRIVDAIEQRRLKQDQTEQETKTASKISNVSRDVIAKHPSRLDESPLYWSVRYAPHPDNVEFNDLRYLARVSKYTGILLHLLMVLIFLFLTTPNVLLSMIERIAIVRPDRVKELTGFQGLVINYASILLQILVTALLPNSITLISRQIPYEDSSSKNHSVMWKVYLFLILMVIVMPSIGMSNAQALFVNDIEPKCLFPTDNGAYYINYVVSSTFLSTVLELIKPTDILYYYFILWTSRSTAEIESGRQLIEREFSVGLQHTGVLLIFAVVMTYSMSCPLIAPVGLLYLILKHSVDHYHLYYTYFTKKVDGSMQSTIVIFVKLGILLMLFQTTVAITLNTGTSYFSLISQMIFWITLAALAFNCFFDFTSRAMPARPRRNKFKHEFCACFYLPRIVESLIKMDAIPQQYISRKL